MQKRFAETMKELRGLINGWSAPSPSFLLAVSGGIDSMCMADLFAGQEDRAPFAMAHCNFRLRGEESDGDEAMVRKWASAHGVVLHVKTFNTQAYAYEHGISIEMAARDLRYAWFAELCRQYGYGAVCVAHNANDNAETLMLNILRGSGLRGLSGMSKISSVPCDPSLPLIRPLLDCTRKQIEGYMFAHKIPYREDSTNASSDYKRNRIRNEAFPIFASVNPSFVNTLNREMGYFAEAGEIVEAWCRTAVPTVVKLEDGALYVDLQELMSNEHWRYLLYYILEPYGFNSAVLTSIENLLTSSRTVSGKIFRSRTHMLMTGRNELIVIPSPGDDVAVNDDAIMVVRGAGTYNFNGRKFKVEVLDRTSDIELKQPEGILMADAEKLLFPFVLRRWRSGDWMIPFGMRGRKKISDLFADLKYDSLRKDSSVVIVDTMTEGMAEDQHVAGIACVRADNRYRITDQTSSIIKIAEIK